MNLEIVNKYFYVKDGVLYSKIARGVKAKKDGEAKGRLASSGYLQIGVNGKQYSKHRILYILYNQIEIPDGLQIDHINGDRLDNTKDNLRLVTGQENGFNRTKAKGFNWKQERQKWRAYITVKGKRKHLGHHDNILDARAAYLRAKRELHIIGDHLG